MVKALRSDDGEPRGGLSPSKLDALQQELTNKTEEYVQEISELRQQLELA